VVLFRSAADVPLLVGTGADLEILASIPIGEMMLTGNGPKGCDETG